MRSQDSSTDTTLSFGWTILYEMEMKWNDFCTRTYFPYIGHAQNTLFHPCHEIKHSWWISDNLSPLAQLMELWKNTSFSFHFKVWNLHGSCLIIWLLVESRIHLSLPLSNLLLMHFPYLIQSRVLLSSKNMFGFPIPLQLGIVLSFSPPLSLSYFPFLTSSNTNSLFFIVLHDHQATVYW